MKKKIIIVVSLIVVLCVGLWFFGYYNRKSNDNIPSKELMVTYYQNKGEDYATEQLKGYKNIQLMEVWGEPDGHLSGFWGDIWENNNTYNIIVYYDSNGIVEHVKVMNKDNEKSNDDSVVFKAKIVEIVDECFLVEPIEESSQADYAERIKVSMKQMDPSHEPEIGDTIEITYNGVMQEENPPIYYRRTRD